MQIKTEKDGLKDIINKVVNDMVDFVKPTYGPANNNIILNTNKNVYALDDGVSISSVFSSEDPTENAIIDLIRDVAGKTSYRVKDGTTTALLLLQGIMNSEHIEDVEVIKKGAEEAKEILLASAKEITKLKDLQKVARIAFNNEIADDIASTVFEVGKYGTVTVEKSNGLDVVFKVITGMEVDAGYVSPHMVTDYNRMEAKLENVRVLVTDQIIKHYDKFGQILEKLVLADERQLFVVSSDIDGDALSFLVVNKLEGKFTTVAINAPYHGVRNNEFNLDLCALTGAKFIEHSKDINSISLDDLGCAEKIISTADKTTIIGGDVDNEEIIERVKYYKEAIEENDNPIEKQRLEKRMASLIGGVGVIQVGANTQQEMDSMIPKVENAKNSVISAYRSGVVKGSGMALRDIETSSQVINDALKIPYQTICKNMETAESPQSIAFNFVTKEIGDYFEVGVIDSVEVLTAAIDSAVSVACLLLKSKGIYVE